MMKPKIVDVPEKMEKFFGKGKMLHPTVDQVEEIVKEIPKGSLTTIDVIAQKMANDFGTDVTCPMRTGNALKKISERYSNDNVDHQIPFWRVIRKDKLIVKSKNHEFSASLIEDEGYKLLFTKNGSIKVEVKTDDLFTF